MPIFDEEIEIPEKETTDEGIGNSLKGEDMEGFHGHNERISTQNMEDGLRKLFLSVYTVSVQENAAQ